MAKLLVVQLDDARQGAGPEYAFPQISRGFTYDGNQFGIVETFESVTTAGRAVERYRGVIIMTNLGEIDRLFVWG
jgi:hypothetical protein